MAKTLSKAKKFVTVPDSVLLLRDHAHDLLGDEYLTAVAYLNGEDLAAEDDFKTNNNLEVVVYVFSHFESLKRKHSFVPVSMPTAEGK